MIRLNRWVLTAWRKSVTNLPNKPNVIVYLSQGRLAPSPHYGWKINPATPPRTSDTVKHNSACLGRTLRDSLALRDLDTKINAKTLQFNKYCKGLPVKASKQQKSFWGWHSICERLQLPLQDELSWSSVENVMQKQCKLTSGILS